MSKNNNIKEEKKEIEIVSGDGSNLDISPVYDHLKLDTVNKKINKEIVIPKAKKKKKEK